MQQYGTQAQCERALAKSQWYALETQQKQRSIGRPFPAPAGLNRRAGRGDVNITFSGNVHISSGDERDFKAAVNRALDQRDNAAGARRRSALFDRD